MLKKTSAVLFCTLLLWIPAQAQELLTVEEALQIGLENNYGVQLFENRSEIAANNRSIGNAGFLPRVGASISQTESVEDSEFEAGGESETTTGARSSLRAAGIDAEWTLFDGFGMFRTYDRLGELQKISDTELRLQMELLALEIIQAYYNITRISEQVSVLENTVDVSSERVEIEEAAVEIGSGSQVDLLQAKSDLNADRAALLRERNLLEEAKFSLNELLSRDINMEFSVSDDIPINRNLSQDELMQKMLNENSELLLAQTSERVAELELKELRSERYPEIVLSSGYSYDRSQNDGGFIRFNETTGFSIGITARINIFDGFNTNRRVQNARINQRNSQLEIEQRKLQLESEFMKLYRGYLNSITLVDLEEENLANAEETLEIALERFRLGTISSLELREAQRTFQTAENRLIEAKFEAKEAETQLLQLSGDLPSVATQ